MTDDRNGMKRCSKCREEKALSCFPKDKSRRDGLFCYCKECTNKARKGQYKSTCDDKLSLFSQGFKRSRAIRIGAIRDKGIDFVTTEQGRIDGFEDVEFAKAFIRNI